MQNFFLNLTRILENNTRIYWSIIFGLLACVALYIAEAVHVQLIVNELNTQDQTLLRATIQPLVGHYTTARWSVFGLAVLWSGIEYFKSKKFLNL